MPIGTINSLSPDLRDVLLNRNLILSDTITDNGLTGYAEGLGSPVATENPLYTSVNPSADINTIGQLYLGMMTGSNPYQQQASPTPIQITDNNVGQIGNGTISSPEYPTSGVNIDESPLFLDEDGDSYRNQSIVQNIYTDPEQQVPVVFGDYSSPANQLGSYTDINNNLRLGGPSTNVADIVGGALTGRQTGVDINTGNLTPNFDLRASLAGRVLGAAGVIGDTPLGQVGAQQLAFNLAQSVSANVQKETIGRVNTNPLSLLSGNDIIVPNYSITTPSGGLKKGIDIASRILGFESPVSLLESSGSIFASESPDVSNTARAQAMILSTGRGQVLSLFDNLRQNTVDAKVMGTPFSQAFQAGYVQRYAPAYQDNRGKTLTKGGDGTNGTLYVGDDGKGNFVNILSDISPDGEIDVIESRNMDAFQFEGLENIPSQSPDQILGLTDKPNVDFTWEDPKFSNLFESVKPKRGILKRTKELFDSGKMKTMVSALESPSELDAEGNVVVGRMSRGSAVLSDANTFCRSFSTLRRYDKVFRLQKHSGINEDVGIRYNTEHSVLEDTGFVKIAPYDDKVKDFMFSIENLAWSDSLADLPECEIGPGDLVTGTKGRIMWFPPYDISFTDTSSVNWDSTNFIGRGEPVYTYNNTERTGTLRFKVIVDHSMALQQMVEDNGVSSEDMISFISGCRELPTAISRRLTANEKNAIDVNTAIDILKTGTNNTKKKQFSVYFPNNDSDLPTTYESGIVNATKVSYTDDSGRTEFYQNDFDLNGNFYTSVSGSSTSPIGQFLTNECPACIVEIRGYASKQGNTTANQGLSDRRANTIKSVITAMGIDESRIIISKGLGETGNATSSSDQDSEEVKRDRKVDVLTYYDPTTDENVNTRASIDKQLFAELNKQIKSRFFDECTYFDKIGQDSPFILDGIKEKLEHFHPAFHSTTPEGFNSRLNFLMQCTRQGPTTNTDDNPYNLAFGRPPVCILRIGDFYNTKIVMDTVNFDFEPLVWDLNPEGIGVQPMIANVDISFKFIGGSSLKGPINKLQNAVTFNYFANTEVYDTRADSIINNELVDGFAPGRAKTKVEKEEEKAKTERRRSEKNQVDNNEKEQKKDSQQQGDDSVDVLKELRMVFTKTSPILDFEISLSIPSAIAEDIVIDIKMQEQSFGTSTFATGSLVVPSTKVTIKAGETYVKYLPFSTIDGGYNATTLSSKTINITAIANNNNTYRKIRSVKPNFDSTKLVIL